MDQSNEYSDPDYHYFSCPRCGTIWKSEENTEECDCTFEEIVGVTNNLLRLYLEIRRRRIT